jgi:tRNA (guanine-N7-)-methyltransferase
MAARKLIDYPEISIKPERLEGRISFGNFFVKPYPVHIEIGSGKGTFLVNQAQAQPEINFLGVEWANKYYRYAVDRIGRWGLSNVRLIRTDAAEFIAEHAPDSSVSCFHIYFPDPWPKKRHHKRRFICEKNMAELLRCLAPGGIINIATDHADYFEQIERVIDFAGEQLERIDFIKPAGADTDEWAGTNFERKYLKEGREIYTIAVKKKD